jgi:hypothetical protein
MNRLVVLGIVGWIVFAGLGGCQGPDAFYRGRDGAVTGSGGHIVVTGSGGNRGNGGSGVGGIRASGGSSAGGSGFGGSSVGGRGGTGAGGTGAGGAGMGGTGAGGRTFDAGQNCLTAIQMAGYMAGTAPPCSACMDQNHTSFAPNCMMMIDCMATKPQPCVGGCELDCFNHSSGSGPLQGCVDALLTAGGCQ